MNVHISGAGIYGGQQLGEFSGTDALTTRTDYVARANYSFNRTFRWTGLCPGRAVTEVGAQENADSAVDMGLAEMNMRLLHGPL